MRKFLVFATATVVGWILATTVVKGNTDRSRVFESAVDDIQCQADDLRQFIREQFKDSASYRELLNISGDIKNRANRLDNLLRRRTVEACDIVSAFEELNCLVRDLHAAIEVARLRAARGLDPPLIGCTLHIDARLSHLSDSLHCLERDLLTRCGYPERVAGYASQPAVTPYREMGHRERMLGEMYPRDMKYGDMTIGRRSGYLDGGRTDIDVPAHRHDSAIRGDNRFRPESGRDGSKQIFPEPNHGISIGSKGRGIDFQPDGGIQLRLGVGNIRIR